METQLKTGNPEDTSSGLSLQTLVNNLVDHSLSVATDNHSLVVNEVSERVVLQSVNEKIIDLLGEVLNTVIGNSNHGDIHISAQKSGNSLVMKIQERNNNNGYALSFSLGTLMSDVNFAGAQMDINTPLKRVTTIIFSFTDRKVA
jgi:hypothetical protein